MQKMLYIPDDKIEIWNEIEKSAKNERRGVGYFLCGFWERIHKPETSESDGEHGN